MALHAMDLSAVRVVIPTFDRPDMLCNRTLELLRRHRFPLDQVHVFVSPRQASNADHPEWYRYLHTMRQAGFNQVHLAVGRDGLEHQMDAIVEWAGSRYVVVMTDDIKDILERKRRRDGTFAFAPLPLAMLGALFLHGRDLLTATGYFAWSLNCSQNIAHMKDAAVSRRFGQLDGNLMGLMLDSDTSSWRVESGMGFVYDVALSCKLWDSGRRFLRYRSLCVSHRFRAEGGYQADLERRTRRRREDTVIKRLQKLYPDLIEFAEKPHASLRTMQFRMRPQGPGPLIMRPATPVTAGRRFEAFANRAMTPAERQRRCRHGLRSLGPA